MVIASPDFRSKVSKSATFESGGFVRNVTEEMCAMNEKVHYILVRKIVRD